MHTVDEGLRGSFSMSMEFVAVLYAVDAKPTWLMVQLMKAYMAETSCSQLLLIESATYVCARDQFAS